MSDILPISRNCGHLVSRDFQKKKTADQPVTAPFDLCADIRRPQTTPFFGLVQYPPPESSYRLLYWGSNTTAHIP